MNDPGSSARQWRDRLSSRSTTLPVSVAEAKRFLRVDHDADDAQIEAMIRAAEDMVENYIGRALITQARVMYRYAWRRIMPLVRTPVQFITSVQYYDSDDVLQTASADLYYLDDVDGAVIQRDDQSWPTSSTDKPWPIRITYSAGYGDASSDVPDGILLAIKNILADSYEQRERLPMMSRGVQAYLTTYLDRSVSHGSGIGDCI